MKNLYILPTDTCFGIACPINEKDSYDKIYEIKGREFLKPLAILCMDFDYLEKNTSINKNQIEFVKNYGKPFTIVMDKEKVKDQELIKNINGLKNSEIYKKIAFRVSHSFMQKRLIQDNGMLFLTSANKSGEPEMFNTKEIRSSFEKEIEQHKIKVFAHIEFKISYIQKYSDIFEFIGEQTEIKYLRKA